jgi:hypothetical protein
VTMNKSGCIHVSRETSALLVVGGKKKWLKQRKDQIGTLKIFWFSKHNSYTIETATQSAIDCGIASLKEDSIAATRERREQLIKWTVEQLVDVQRKSCTSTHGDVDQGCLIICIFFDNQRSS